MSNRIVILTDEYNLMDDFICDIEGNIVYRLLRKPNMMILYYGFTKFIVAIIEQEEFYIWDSLIEYLKGG